MQLDIKIPKKHQRDTTLTFKCNGTLKARVGVKLKAAGLKWVDVFEGTMIAIDEGKVTGNITLQEKKRK